VLAVLLAVAIVRLLDGGDDRLEVRRPATVARPDRRSEVDPALFAPSRHLLPRGFTVDRARTGYIDLAALLAPIDPASTAQLRRGIPGDERAYQVLLTRERNDRQELVFGLASGGAGDALPVADAVIRTLIPNVELRPTTRVPVAGDFARSYVVHLPGEREPAGYAVAWSRGLRLGVVVGAGPDAEALRRDVPALARLLDRQALRLAESSSP
jgi:hypothetical protein